jgi:hypothetical protein
MASDKAEGGISPPESFRRFQRLLGHLLTVTKEESDKQMADLRERNKQKRAGKAKGHQ